MFQKDKTVLPHLHIKVIKYKRLCIPRSTYVYMQMQSKRPGRICIQLKSCNLWGESRKGRLGLVCWSSNWILVFLFFNVNNIQSVFNRKKRYFGCKPDATIQIFAIYYSCELEQYILSTCFSSEIFIIQLHNRQWCLHEHTNTF